MTAAALFFTVLLSQTAAPSPAASEAPTPIPGAAPEPTPGPEAATPFPPPPPPPPEPPRYGDRGTSEIAVGVGYSSASGFLAAGGYRHFVVRGLAPGLEAHYFGGGSVGSAFGLVLGNLRLVPVRTDGFALVLTGRAGRVFLADHADGWAAGGSVGVVIFLGPHVGLEVGYEALRLLPAGFCADLARCVLHGPVFGLRFVF